MAHLVSEASRLAKKIIVLPLTQKLTITNLIKMSYFVITDDRNRKYCIKHCNEKYDEFYWHGVVSKFNIAFGSSFRGLLTEESLSYNFLESRGYTKDDIYFENLRSEYNTSPNVAERIPFI